MYKQGDKVRRIESLELLDSEFDGDATGHGKKVGTVVRIYEDLGSDVCDLQYSDGSTDEKISVDELEPAA